MSTHAPTVSDLELQRPLQEVAAAATDADRALSAQDEIALRESVIALGRAAAEVLAQTQRLEPPASRPERLKEVLAWWRQQLDEARLQVVLAEMDAHDAADDLLVALERRFSGVSELISSSVERISTALVSLRTELQGYAHPGQQSERTR